MVVFIVPLPRYLMAACCSNTSHVSNCLAPEFAGEISRTEKCLADAAVAGGRTGEARLVNILSFFGSAESLFQDLSPVDGVSIWAGDGWRAPHLQRARVVTSQLMLDVADGGPAREPTAKRARLGSIIPALHLSRDRCRSGCRDSCQWPSVPEGASTGTDVAAEGP
jgi:hypothetical protein